MLWPLTDLSLSSEVKAILTSLFLLSDISPLIPMIHTQYRKQQRTHRHTHIDTHTHANTHTVAQTHTHTHAHTHTHTHANRARKTSLLERRLWKKANR